MTQSGPVISIGGAKVPTLVAGLTLSIAAHAGVLGVMALVPTGRGRPAAAPPVLRVARGEPIRVRVVSGRTAEAPGPDPAAIGDIEDAAAAGAERDDAPAGRPGTPAVEPVAPAADPAGPPSRPTRSSFDLASFVESLRPFEREAVAAPPEAPAPAGAREPAATPVPSPPAPARPDAPRGIDRGVAVVDVAPPVYPPRSIRLGHEGTALVEITVRADGRVAAVRLREGSGHRRLDEAAIEAARTGRFSPALRDGRPVEAVVVVPFEFRLRDGR